MIQRIQTIWLVLAALCFGLAFLPGWSLVDTAQPGKQLLEDQRVMLLEHPVMIGGAALSILCMLVGIGLFRNRTAQALVVGVGSIIQILGVVSFAMYLVFVQNLWQQMMPGFAAISGVIGAFFAWMANRAIRKDEQLLKSMDRLR
ncbi:MAG TPA: DUF4293 domain-containing protein [Saprospiraceae bacterium]|nr:DUF4293 domain-containing protein [Saprospiraceae bacterium]